GSFDTFSGYYEPITPRMELTRFLERLLGILHIDAGGEKLEARELFGKSEEWLSVSRGEHFRRNDDPVATLSFLPADSDGTLLQSYGDSARGNHRAIPAWLVWTEWLLTAFSLALMLSSALFALVWVPRKLLRRMKGVPGLSIRILPLLSVLCLAGACAL